jgi:tripartite-type tricarboxylate transporter receptor subunit TctC
LGAIGRLKFVFATAGGIVMKNVVAFLVVVLSAVLVAPARAQSYPIKPVRIIVPFLPGDAADILARLIGQKISERLGQQVIVENRSGAAGQLGLELTAHAASDGYTITVGQGGNTVVAAHTYKKLAYDPVKDFAPVALLVWNGLVLVVHPSAPFRNARDLINYAKANPSKLAFASNGEGAFVHLSFELFRLQAGFTYLHVPYKSMVLGLTELMGGQVDMAMPTFASVSPYVRSGKLRLLGTTNPTRVPQLAEFPALAETIPGYESRGWFGFLAPVATPREIVVRLNLEINRAMELPDLREKIMALGFTIDTGSPEHFETTIRNDYAKYGKLVRDIGLQPQ